MLIIAGDQVPDIPSNDVVGNEGAGVPEQKEGIGVKVGVVVVTQGTVQVMVCAGTQGNVVALNVRVAD